MPAIPERRDINANVREGTTPQGAAVAAPEPEPEPKPARASRAKAAEEQPESSP